MASILPYFSLCSHSNNLILYWYCKQEMAVKASILASPKQKGAAPFCFFQRPFVFFSAPLFHQLIFCPKINFANFFSYFGTQTRFKLSANVKLSIEQVRDKLEWICNWYCQQYLSWCWLHQSKYKHDHYIFLFSIQTSVGSKNKAQLLINFLDQHSN